MTVLFLCSETLRRSWDASSNRRGAMLLGMLGAVLSMLTLNVLLVIMQLMLNLNSTSFTYALLSLLFAILQLPFSMGITQLGMDAANSREKDWQRAFCHVESGILIWKVFVATALSSFLVSIGLLCFIVPGIYLAVAYMAVIPLLLQDPRQGIWSTLEESRKRISAAWFQGLLLALTQLGLTLCCFLIIPIYWLAPWLVTMIPTLVVATNPPSPGKQVDITDP
eukprot:CAMPEP_0184685496 /NCGR_PEP_ID=MMETSP0312-20130426/19192_1 /TAXON_ID=31354 /ORGANISM="Compsopogon coeruleus, Strain SAG 36.94" /LENGTH=222 /DNA_ID=CAMNT_0027139655 /DNA_START=130 /DNA_END=798 /DNA_ORIENTATION=-